jgi:thioester reductase-like protein
VRRDVFVTGGTGYLGRPLIEALLPRRAVIDALVKSIESPADGVAVLEAPQIRPR